MRLRFWSVVATFAMVCWAVPQGMCEQQADGTQFTQTGLPSKDWLRLVADTNRDGVVDFERDGEGRDQWSWERGALFFFNNNSDEDKGEPDHADRVVNGARDLQNLALIRLEKGTADHIDTGSGSHGLRVETDEASRGRVRLFVSNDDGGYEMLSMGESGGLPFWRFLEGGLELRIEALSYADSEWSGETTVTVCIVAGSSGSPIGDACDSVKLRVAPFIMLSNLQEAKTVYVRAFPERNDRLIEQLSEIVPRAGAELHVIPEESAAPYPYHNIWLQDTMEIGYSQFPGRRMNVVLKANRNRPLDDFPKNELLGPDFGWFEVGSYRPEFASGSGGKSWLDWFGNLEVSPPLPDFPLGRVYYGVDGDDGLDPAIVEMLAAQQVQGPPLGLDVGWLLIKHVDEAISFIPWKGGDGPPFRMLVPDAGLGARLLMEWAESGHGDVPMLGNFSDPGNRYHLEPLGKYGHPVTVGALAADTELMNYNRQLQTTRINQMIRRAVAEFGIDPGAVVRVPFLQSQSQTALFPNMVNLVVLNGHLLVSDPDGPVVEGVDLLQEYFLTAVEGSGLEVHFVDDRQYHKWSGNVHCATNVRRKGFPEPWWRMLAGKRWAGR